MSAARVIVPYAARGPRPRARLAGLGCGCGCGGAGLGRLGTARVRPSLSSTGELGAAVDWGAFSRKLNAAVRAAVRRPGTLGALGLNQGESSAVEGASAGAKAGSVVPGIGTAVGAVVGAIAGYILGSKHYFNVGQSNQACQQLLQAWQQYLQIQGHVPGRALGWENMQALFHAAVGAGLFPGNDMHLSFHGGTLQCAGHGDWVDEALGNGLGPVCGAHNCLPDALQVFNQRRGQVPAPEAVYFIDSIWVPMNAGAKIPWIANGASNPQVHQLLYDLADAYLAASASGTTPYVEYPQAPVQASGQTLAVAQALGLPSQAPAASTATPAAIVPPAATPAPATVPYTSPPSAAASAGGTIPLQTEPGATLPPAAGAVPTDQTSALIQSLLAQGASQQQAYSAALNSLAANGVNTSQPAVQSQVAGAVQAMSANGAGVVGMSPTAGLWMLAGLGGAVVLLATRKRRAH